MACWQYNADRKYGEIVKNDELRCMGVVEESGTLLIGTNTFTILTQSVADWINFSQDDMSAYALEMGVRYGEDGEEVKEDLHGTARPFDEESKFADSDAASIDDEFNAIYAREKNNILAQLQEEQRRILDQDAMGGAQAYGR